MAGLPTLVYNDIAKEETMNKLNRTQTSLLLVQMLRMVLEIFTNTFLTSHIISLSPDNIFGSGLFNVAILYISQYVAYILVYIVNS